ncbi:LYR motif-containing protein 4B-like [Macrosteles quadrilineatus]|uniref:LYR motif-containing protein 4B-like n=1 Tax=Macrosteles quadrilineatus TaxID=74068 RepID=UPI0023E14FE3|nr:LYR motif-containing protein 4B-like [Macrosteles quadrilineatus]
MAGQTSKTLKLYKTLLKEASKFPLYNFRMYALRRIHDKFKENKCLIDTAAIEQEFNEGLKALEVIKRQVTVSQLYEPEKLIIEKSNKNKH